MGILSILRRESPIEALLFRTYVQSWAQSGMPLRQAKAMTRQMLNEARRKAKAMGTLHWHNLAELYLENARTDPETNSSLAAKRADGVTDDDIRWWWNLYELERRMMILQDQITKMAAFDKYIDEGMSSIDAGVEARMAFPIYGDPCDTSVIKEEHRPLPIELKDRINLWAIEQSISWDGNIEKLQEQVAEVGSLNALIRVEVRAARL